MAEVTQSNFINSGLQAGIYQPVRQVQNIADTPNTPSIQPLSEQVELSPQAKLLQQNERLNQARQESLFSADNAENNNEANAAGRVDSVRVSSTIGEAASSVGLTEQEAIKLYQSIKALL